MCNFMDAVPTGDYPIKNGTSLILGVEHAMGTALNFELGAGTCTAISSTQFEANGNYDFDELGYSGKGTWSVSFNSASGENWDLTISFSGTFSGTKKGTLTCSQQGSGSDTTITYSGDLSGSSSSIIQSYQNNGPFQDPKLYFANLPVGGKTAQIYMYNKDA